MAEEKLHTVCDSSIFSPKEGWALFERTPPSKLNPDARAFLVDIFNSGKENRNKRVNHDAAEIMLRDNFPGKQECWLSAKQVICVSLQFMTLLIQTSRSRACSAN